MQKNSIGHEDEVTKRANFDSISTAIKKFGQSATFSAIFCDEVALSPNFLNEVLIESKSALFVSSPSWPVEFTYI